MGDSLRFRHESVFALATGFFDLSLLALKFGLIAVELGLLIGLSILLTLELIAYKTPAPSPSAPPTALRLQVLRPWPR